MYWSKINQNIYWSEIYQNICWSEIYQTYNTTLPSEIYANTYENIYSPKIQNLESTKTFLSKVDLPKYVQMSYEKYIPQRSKYIRIYRDIYQTRISWHIFWEILSRRYNFAVRSHPLCERRNLHILWRYSFTSTPFHNNLHIYIRSMLYISTRISIYLLVFHIFFVYLDQFCDCVSMYFVF